MSVLLRLWTSRAMGSDFFKKGRQVRYLFSSSEAFMQEVNFQSVSKENALKGPREDRMQFPRARQYFSESRRKGWKSNSDRGTRTGLRVYPVQADFKLMFP